MTEPNKFDFATLELKLLASLAEKEPDLVQKVRLREPLSFEEQRRLLYLTYGSKQS